MVKTMSDNEQMNLVQKYRQLVQRYEALDKQIDELIMRHGGGTESMSAADLHHYRELADQRTEALNEMRILERQLDIDSGID